MPWVNRLRRPSRSAHEESGVDRVAPEGLSVWENEGGSTRERSRAKPLHLAALLEQGMESAADLALKAKRQTQRARVALELRRLESRLTSEMEGLGHDLFPLLKEESLRIDLPTVRQRMNSIAELQGEIDRKKARSEALRRVGERNDARNESMANIDANATEEASALQSAEDEAAEAGGQPAEQGGEG